MSQYELRHSKRKASHSEDGAELRNLTRVGPVLEGVIQCNRKNQEAIRNLALATGIDEHELDEDMPDAQPASAPPLPWVKPTPDIEDREEGINCPETFYSYYSSDEHTQTVVGDILEKIGEKLKEKQWVIDFNIQSTAESVDLMIAPVYKQTPLPSQLFSGLQIGAEANKSPVAGSSRTISGEGPPGLLHIKQVISQLQTSGCIANKRSVPLELICPDIDSTANEICKRGWSKDFIKANTEIQALVLGVLNGSAANFGSVPLSVTKVLRETFLKKK